ERPVDQAEGAPADGRDERHLVAVGELVPALRVAAVHGVEQAGRLVAEPERRPDVLHPRHVLELEARAAGAFPQAGEETDGDAHALILPVLLRYRALRCRGTAQAVRRAPAACRGAACTCRRPPGSARSRPGAGAPGGDGSSTSPGRSPVQPP